MHPLDPWRVANLLVEQHGLDSGLHARPCAPMRFGTRATQWEPPCGGRFLDATDAPRRTRRLSGEALH